MLHAMMPWRNEACELFHRWSLQRAPTDMSEVLDSRLRGRTQRLRVSTGLDSYLLIFCTMEPLQGL